MITITVKGKLPDPKLIEVKIEQAIAESMESSRVQAEAELQKNATF